MKKGNAPKTDDHEGHAQCSDHFTNLELLFDAFEVSSDNCGAKCDTDDGHCD